MSIGTKKRSPYDKIIKQVLEQFRHELEPVHEVAATQQTLFEQNEKIIHFLRQIWQKCEECENLPRSQGPG